LVSKKIIFLVILEIIYYTDIEIHKKKYFESGEGGRNHANIDINSYLSAVDLNLFLDITTLLFNIADSTPTERDVGKGSPSKLVKRTESIFCVSSRSPIGFTSVAAIGKWY